MPNENALYERQESFRSKIMKPFRVIVYLTILLIFSGCLLLKNKSAVLQKNNSPEGAAVSPTATPSEINENDSEIGENAESFKPKNWFVLKQAESDIDGDEKNDLVAVFSKDDPETEKSEISDEDGDAARLFIIALKNSDGKFKRVFSGSNIILCRYCGGMNGNVVPEIEISECKIYVDQNVLATSDVDYHLEITLKNNKLFVLTKGSVKNRERRTGKNDKNIIKTPMPLIDFDVNDY